MTDPGPAQVSAAASEPAPEPEPAPVSMALTADGGARGPGARMPGEPRAAMRPVEARLLAAAVQLFARKGFDGTSVQEIVAEAQVTKGAMYHYFSSKDDLLYEIYNRLLSRQLADLDRILGEGLPAPETVRAVVMELICTTAEQIDEAKVFGREMHKLDDEHLKAVRADRRRYHVAFREIIETAQREGAFSSAAPADTVTYVVFGVVNELPQWFRPDGPKPAETIAAEVADFVLAALAPPPSSP